MHCMAAFRARSHLGASPTPILIIAAPQIRVKNAQIPLKMAEQKKVSSQRCAKTPR